MDGTYFRALGPLEVVRDGVPLDLGPPQQRALLAVLLVHHDQPRSAGSLAADLWGDDAPATATKSVQKYVSQLRRLLGADRIDSEHGYRLRVARHECDLFELEDAVATAERGDGARARALERALALWHGPPFADLPANDALVPVQVRCTELWLTANEGRHDALLATGRAAEVVASTEALVLEHPLRERLWFQRILALARSGRQADALRAYEAVRTTLAEELGIEPSPELRDLERTVLLQEDRTRWDAGPPDDVPARTTSIVGRGGDVASVASLLERARLVTVVGAGGAGKTTLAEEVARRVAGRHPGGVRYVELAELATPEEVPAFVLDALGVGNQEGRPVGRVLAELLRGRGALLVLDNCEHVLDAIASVVADLLRAAPDASVLATSREPLALGGEAVYALQPLAVPSEQATDDEVVDADAVRLLVERAQATTARLDDPAAHAAALAELARRLGGLPLALELAAAQLRLLSPEELLDHLERRSTALVTTRRDVADRHRSLDATIDASRSRLTADQRQTFDQLAVFRGGFTLAAAAAVCDLPERELAPLVGELVDGSLVSVDPRRGPRTRYELLEPIRQFAHDALEAAGEADVVRARRDRWALTFAADAASAFKEVDQRRAGDDLDDDLANLRAAFFDAVARGDLELCLGLVAPLRDYAHDRLRDEVFDWMQRASTLPGAEEHPAHPFVLGCLARGLINRGERARAMDLADAVIERTGPRHPAAFDAWKARASCAIYEGRFADAHRCSMEGVAIARATGDRADEAYAFLTVVLAAAFAGDALRAASTLDELRALAAASGSPGQIAWSHYAAAEVVRTTDPDAAAGELARAIQIAEAVHSDYVLGIARLALASIQTRHGDPVAALRSFAWLVDHWERRGDWTHQWNTLRNLVDLLHRLGDDDSAGRLLDAVEAAATAAPAYGELQRRLASAHGARARPAPGGDRPPALGNEGAVRHALDVIAGHLARLDGA